MGWAACTVQHRQCGKVIGELYGGDDPILNASNFTWRLNQSPELESQPILCPKCRVYCEANASQLRQALQDGKRQIRLSTLSVHNADTVITPKGR